MKPDLLRHACVAALACLIGGCNGTSSTQPMPTPTFGQLHIPDPAGANTWSPFTATSGTFDVLPTRGRGVRVYFYAPAGSTFDVSLRALDGTMTMLPESSGAPAPPENGYFQIIDVNTSNNPAIYGMYARAPLALADPANFDVLVVNKSLRTDRTDSTPMMVTLRARKVYSVKVIVNGSGHVTSNPSGIQCGSAPSGSALNDCEYSFGPGTVSLAPNSNDMTTTRFLEWAGNCAPGVQVCNVTLDGSGPTVAVATFVARNSVEVPSACTAAPIVAGWRWIGLPDCDIRVSTGISRSCDTAGYFCCAPAAPSVSSARCGGSGKTESAVDCRQFAPRGLLKQPGGCYEVDQ